MSAPSNTLVLRPRLQRADECLRPTRAEIDLGAIASNFRTIQTTVGRARVLAVVKADGYGHGVVPVAQRLEQEGAYGFGVALAEEAIELRDAGIQGEILILNGVVGGAHEDVLERGLVPVVYDLDQLKAFSRASKGQRFRVHLKVDTGMARLGVPMGALAAFLQDARSIAGLHLEGLMTHLAAADADDEYTTRQLQEFERAIQLVRAAGHRPSVLHAANSAATFRHPSARYDIVRPGVALFGHPGFTSPEMPTLRSAMRLRTEVIALKHVQPGDRIGYDGAYVAPSKRVLAIVPMGYGDGLMRSAGGRAEALVAGKRCPLVGRISMDLSHVDVSDLPGVVIGDEVVVLGRQSGAHGEDEITIADLANAAQTVPYEVLTNVSRRVPRFYRP